MAYHPSGFRRYFGRLPCGPHVEAVFVSPWQNRTPWRATRVGIHRHRTHAKPRDSESISIDDANAKSWGSQRLVGYEIYALDVLWGMHLNGWLLEYTRMGTLVLRLIPRDAVWTMSTPDSQARPIVQVYSKMTMIAASFVVIQLLQIRGFSANSCRLPGTKLNVLHSGDFWLCVVRKTQQAVKKVLLWATLQNSKLK